VCLLFCADRGEFGSGRFQFEQISEKKVEKNRTKIVEKYSELRGIETSDCSIMENKEMYESLIKWLKVLELAGPCGKIFLKKNI
jgi:hypothetical protein